MTAYYNENDPKAAAGLRELIARGDVAPDDKSVSAPDITSEDMH